MKRLLVHHTIRVYVQVIRINLLVKGSIGMVLGVEGVILLEKNLKDRIPVERVTLVIRGTLKIAISHLYVL